MSEEPDLHITLQPEWGTGPIWIRRGDSISEPYDAEEVTEVLDLSDELRQAIAAWDERFQNTFNSAYPPDSAFPTPDDEAAWLADGKQLALRLRREVPVRCAFDMTATHCFRPCPTGALYETCTSSPHTYTYHRPDRFGSSTERPPSTRQGFRFIEPGCSRTPLS